MITDIFDLMSQAGMEDPRTNAEFRRYLLERLQEIENGLIGENGIEKAYEDLSIPEKASFIQNAQRQVENNPSVAEKTQYINKLLDAYQANVDIKKILTMTPKDIEGLTTLPQRL